MLNKTMCLIILDGWGYRENTEHNAIKAALTPRWDALWGQYPHTLIEGSGHFVGLPDGQMGNSEVGHLNIGMGRPVHQDLTRIHQSIKNREFFANPVLCSLFKQAKATHKAVHLIGLLSPGGVHSHQEHFYAMLELAKQQQVSEVYIHAFLDGRDTPPQSAALYLEQLEQQIQTLGCGHIASIIGRYFAMDRDKRWNRTELAYRMLTTGHASYTADCATQAIHDAYARGETDEFVAPTTITPHFHAINDGDFVIFMNFRADRARQLTQSLIASDFQEFVRASHPHLGGFVSLTQYAQNLPTQIAFPSEPLNNGLGETIAKLNLRQLRIAETEKYAHVTFFFNGGVETPFPNEERVLIPSPKVATYDLKPEMSANELTNELIRRITSEQYALIVCNFANADMVGHSGNFKATVTAIETIDTCLDRIYSALKQTGAEMLITSDHGNAECMFDDVSGQPHTAHTSQPIPLIYVGRPAILTSTAGKLSDIAPTLLTLMGIPVPKEMTGKCLFDIQTECDETLL